VIGKEKSCGETFAAGSLLLKSFYQAQRK